MAWVHAETSAGRVALEPEIGNIRVLKFRVGDRTLAPLHTAPWADDPALVNDPETDPLEARLAGDFLCAPFGAADLDGGPPHGWTANSRWRLIDERAGGMTFELDRDVMGARVTKTLALAPDAPILYQTHLIEGGVGRLTIAHHPMIRLGSRGRFSTSPKRAALTPEVPLVPGRHRLALGQRATDLTRIPAEEGGTVDLRDLPIADRHEDFIALVEAPGASMGWSAIVREAEADIFFVLKDPDVLPLTMLWHSNGGRDFPPWNGRHRGVVGIEDGCTAGAAGHRAALVPNPISDEGVPSALTLGGTIRIAQVTGALPRPEGWTEIADITTSDGRLTLWDVSGAEQSMPYDTGFLRRAH